MLILGCLTVCLGGVAAFQSLNDEDLVTYMTVSNSESLLAAKLTMFQLPKYRIMKWNITYHDRAAVAPGYWFVAPYFLNEGEARTNMWIPDQIGAHIFDQDGVGLLPCNDCFTC